MRRVKIDSIIYYSNQDPEHPASNLLDLGLGKSKKWLCARGEPFCSVVLQLERVVKIAAVHIGTCMAGLIEVQVGRSETPTVPCEILLPRIEFKCLPTLYRIRDGGEQHASFSTDQMLQRTSEKTWDRMRIVCSRPFEQDKYGLNFIEIFENVDMDQPELVRALGPALPSRMLGCVRDSSPEEDYVRPEPRRNNAGAGRQAASQVVKKVKSVKKAGMRRSKKNFYRRKKTKRTTNLKKQKETPMETDDNEEQHTKSHDDGKDQEEKKKESPKKDEQEPSTSKSFNKHSDDKKEKTLNNSGSQNSSKDNENSKDNTKDLNTSRGKKDSKDEKKKKDEEKAPTQKKGDSKQNKDQTAKSNSRKRPHSGEQKKGKAVRASQRRLLGSVVFALSGYSPARSARLRAAAEAMGASFQADWSPRCTHLICASSNAPEFKTARASKASCIAVHGEWVERCSARRRRLPWQWFATERAHRLARPPADDQEMEDRRVASGISNGPRQ